MWLLNEAYEVIVNMVKLLEEPAKLCSLGNNINQLAKDTNAERLADHTFLRVMGGI